MALNDVAHLGCATPAQRDAGAAVSVIVNDELVRDRLGIEPIGTIAKRPHAGNAGPRQIGIEGEIGRRQIGRRRHIHFREKDSNNWPKRTGNLKLMLKCLMPLIVRLFSEKEKRRRIKRAAW